MAIARATLQAWLDAYGRAWEEMDPDAGAGLFAEDATYRETPFDEPMRGREAIREYWRGVPQAQRDIRFEHEVLAADGDRAIAWWRARFRRVRTGDVVTLDGIFVLAFDEDGRCSSLREWWVRREEAAEG
jgi:ketosteroid isomerase-like protein